MNIRIIEYKWIIRNLMINLSGKTPLLAGKIEGSHQEGEEGTKPTRIPRNRVEKGHKEAEQRGRESQDFHWNPEKQGELADANPQRHALKEGKARETTWGDLGSDYEDQGKLQGSWFVIVFRFFLSFFMSKNNFHFYFGHIWDFILFLGFLW